MTGVRERLGFVTGALIAILAFGLLAVAAANSHAEGPSELARAGIPAGPRIRTSTTPASRRSARNRARAPRNASKPGRKPFARARPARTGSGPTSRRAVARLPRRQPAGPARSRSIRRGRLGASDRGRSLRPVRVRPRDPLRRQQAMPGQLPDAVHRAHDQLGRRRNVGSEQAAVRLQGLRPVRPDHRGRPGYGRGLRPVHERLQHHVHEVHEPRRDLVGTGQDVRQRLVERQAGHRDERQRPGRLRLVQRPDRWRSVGRPLDQRRRDLEPGQARRFGALLLRVRCRRRSRRHRLLRRIEPAVRRWRQQGDDPDGHGRRAPLHLARPGRHVDQQGRRQHPARYRLHGRRLHARLLLRPQTPSRPMPAAPRVRVRRRDDRRRQAVDLRDALDRSRDDVVDARRDLDRRRAGHRADDRVPRRQASSPRSGWRPRAAATWTRGTR